MSDNEFISLQRENAELRGRIAALESALAARDIRILHQSAELTRVKRKPPRVLDKDAASTFDRPYGGQ